MESYLPIYALASPLVGALVALISPKGVREAASTIFAAIPLLILGMMTPYVLAGETLICNVGILFGVDALSWLILLVVTLLGFLAVVYSIGYAEKEIEEGKLNAYYCFVLLFVASMVGMAMVQNLLYLYVFMEVMTVTSALAVVMKGVPEALEASYKYLILSLFGSVFIILSIAIFLTQAHTLALDGIRTGLQAAVGGSVLLNVAVVCLLFGFGTKAGMVPLHAWLPDVHAEAPTPVSALFSGAAIHMGIYALFRSLLAVMPALDGFGGLLAALGLITMIVGLAMAIAQRDLKRMLAYSSIDEIGYMLLAFGMGTSLGMSGAIFHIFNHALAKALLFLCAGVVLYHAGRNIYELGGLASKMPTVAVGFLVGLLAISGVPPLNGFWSKLMIYKATFDAGFWYYTIIAMVASVMTLAYYLRAFHRIFMAEPEAWRKVSELPVAKLEEVVAAPITTHAAGVTTPTAAAAATNPGRTPTSMLIPIIVLAVACLLVGFFPEVLLKIVESCVMGVMP